MGLSAADFFAAYDAFGERRPGSAADAASAEWLRGLAAATGAHATRVEGPFAPFVPGAAFAEVGGRRIDGLPLFDGGTTGPEGVAGRIGPLGSDAPLGVLETEPRAAKTREIHPMTRTNAHSLLTVGLRLVAAYYLVTTMAGVIGQFFFVQPDAVSLARPIWIVHSLSCVLFGSW